MASFLGIDGGGSKTRCVVGDEHRVLGTALTSSCKIQRVGEDEARRALHTVVKEACDAAGVSANRIERACIGIAGITDTSVAEWVQRALGQVISAPVEVVSDVMIALEAAFGDAPGCIVVAGTGSIAVGRDEEGKLARTGGWGPSVSDEGSGYWIGRAAVAATLRAYDSGKNTALLPAIMDAWRVSNREEFTRMASTSPPPDFAQLFPRVLQVAEMGDATATEIIMRAGFELAEMAMVVIRQLWPDNQRVRVAVSGGVLQNSRMIRQVFASTLRCARPEAALTFGNIEAVMGALMLARKAKARKVTV
jgi:N-acetylglucosamine kinase-like BadF-type ATPase